MNTLRINSITVKNHIIKSAILCGNEYWFKFPIDAADDLTDRADPFIVALIFPMMRIGGDIQVIGGGVSQTLLDNIKMFCAIWNLWRPEQYKPVNIIADKIADKKFDNNGKLITCFSGGLDAAYTAYKYANKLATGKNYKYNKSIFVHGADIPLDNTEQFKIAYSAAKKMTDDLPGVSLTPVITNYREYQNDWEMEHGALFAGLLMFFEQSYAFGCVSNDSVLAIKSAPIWGINPYTNHLLSSDVFRFFDDGAEHSRSMRAGIIKNWSVGLANLRVCWAGADKSKNCGKCEKCMRTKMNFLANDVKHIECMPTDFCERELCDIAIGHSGHFWTEALSHAQQVGVNIPPRVRRIITRKIKNKHHSIWWHICKLLGINV